MVLAYFEILHIPYKKVHNFIVNKDNDKVIINEDIIQEEIIMDGMVIMVVIIMYITIMEVFTIDGIFIMVIIIDAFIIEILNIKVLIEVMKTVDIETSLKSKMVYVRLIFLIKVLEITIIMDTQILIIRMVFDINEIDYHFFRILVMDFDLVVHIVIAISQIFKMD